jgi:signal transduction histidine kinase
MKQRFGNLPLREKLILSGFVPSIVVLIAASAVFVAYDIFAFKQSLIGSLQGTAHFIALTTRAAVRFNQPEYANKILQGLASNNDVTAACIYDEENNVFARYPSKLPDKSFPVLIRSEPPETPADKIWIWEPIELQNKKIGNVFVDAGYFRLLQRLRIVSAGALGVVVVLLVAAYALASRLQRHISRPLSALAITAHRISEDRDYSVRVEPERGPEFAALTEAFNHMLSQIDARDAELQQRARDLEVANEELEAFTYTISHDLRSPLRSVAGFTQMLETQYQSNLDDEGRMLARRIRAGAERMGELIDDLLSFSRTGTEPLKLELCDPGAIARKVFDELISQGQPRKVDFQVDKMPLVQADPALLEQVYVNLLSNALKYSRNRTVAKIQAGAAPSEGKPAFFVKDNGVGFDMSHASHLFQVFHRLHKAAEFEGTGVGLAIVQRIISRHGGRIWPEAARDQGATFYFTLN